MTDNLPPLPGSRKNIPDEATNRKDSEVLAVDSHALNLEKDLCALLELCVHLLELEGKKKEIGRIRHELRDADTAMAVKLKKEEIALREIITATQKRLKCADTKGLGL